MLIKNSFCTWIDIDFKALFECRDGVDDQIYDFRKSEHQVILRSMKKISQSGNHHKIKHKFLSRLFVTIELFISFLQKCLQMDAILPRLSIAPTFRIHKK